LSLWSNRRFLVLFGVATLLFSLARGKAQYGTNLLEDGEALLGQLVVNYFLLAFVGAFSVGLARTVARKWFSDEGEIGNEEFGWLLIGSVCIVGALAYYVLSNIRV
jgi:hypothetical protein